MTIKKGSLQKITPHFSRQEFDCQDGSSYPDEWITSRLKPLCEALELIREQLGKPLIISSGYRTVKHNRRIGGVRNSQHVQGQAADIQCSNVTSSKICKIIRSLIAEGKIPKGGVGLYSSFVHYDIRGRNAFWKGK